MVRRVWAGEVWYGLECPGESRRGEARWGWAGMARLDQAYLVRVWRVWAVYGRCGVAESGGAGLGVAGLVLAR